MSVLDMFRLAGRIALATGARREIGQALAQRIPVGRLERPDDLVGAAPLLCSDAGRYNGGASRDEAGLSERPWS